MSIICLDSSAWIEMALGGPNAMKFGKAFKSGHKILSSVISVYEIQKYLARSVDDSSAQELIAVICNEQVAQVTPDLALHAADLAVRHQLAMADALIYATAIAHQATLWTQDKDFEGLPHVKYFAKGGA